MYKVADCRAIIPLPCRVWHLGRRWGPARSLRYSYWSLAYHMSRVGSLTCAGSDQGSVWLSLHRKEMGRPSTSTGDSHLRSSCLKGSHQVVREDYWLHCCHHQICFCPSVDYHLRDWQSDLIRGPVMYKLYSGHSSCSFGQGEFEGWEFDSSKIPSYLCPPSASWGRAPFPFNLLAFWL